MMPKNGEIMILSMIAVDDDESTVEELYKEYLSENKIK